MKFKALSLIALVLVFSVFAEENSQNAIKGDEPLHTNTFFGGFGGGGGSGGVGYGSGGGGGGSSGVGYGSGGGGGGSGGVGYGSGGGGAGGYSAGFSHGGVYGGGQKCKWGCCSESFGYSHGAGGYYSCTCCATAAEAKAYQLNQPKSAEPNN